MKLNFKSFNDQFDLNKAIEEQFLIGIATPSDVQTFAKAQGLKCSGLIMKSDLSADHIKHLIKAPFDGQIICTTPTRKEAWPWSWFYSWQWCIEFHFLENKLIEIITYQMSDGI